MACESAEGERAGVWHMFQLGEAGEYARFEGFHGVGRKIHRGLCGDGTTCAAGIAIDPEIRQRCEAGEHVMLDACNGVGVQILG